MLNPKAPKALLQAAQKSPVTAGATVLCPGPQGPTPWVCGERKAGLSSLTSCDTAREVCRKQIAARRAKGLYGLGQPAGSLQEVVTFLEAGALGPPWGALLSS